MKTPLTQLINRLEAMQAAAPIIERNVYTKAIREAKEMLHIELDSIKQIWVDGALNWNNLTSANQYINRTYSQPTKTDSTDND